MRSIGYLNIAALVTSIMMLLIAFILVPEKSWNTATTISIIIFALTVGFIFYIPNTIMKRQDNSNATQLASIGPLGIITGLMLPLTASAFVMALLDFPKIAYVLDVLAVSGFIVSGLILNAALNVINDVAEQSSMPSKHFTWQGTFQGLSAVVSDADSKIALEKLIEKLRYMPSDVAGGSPQDSAIESIVQEINNELNLDNSANIQSLLGKIEVLVAQRDIYLRSARSNA